MDNITLEEALASAEIIEETESICIIDADTRTISVPKECAMMGVVSDEKAKRIKFKCPKIVGDNIDLSKFNLYVNYSNAKGELNAYLIEDMGVDGDYITFSWLLSRHVTMYKGNVSFIVCAKKADENGNIVNEWNTTVASGIVIEGLEAEVVIEEYNADVIEQILSKIEVDQTYSPTSENAQSGIAVSEALQQEIDQAMSKTIGRKTAEGGEIFNDYENNKALAYYSHAEGNFTTASGDCSHAEGYSTTASGYSSHAEGNIPTASGDCSHAEGYSTTASSYSSHAEGNITIASGDCSHAEGDSTTASGYSSHAEGVNTTASGIESHAEGSSTKASGGNSHAEGDSTTASGARSHAEGFQTIASGDNSHAGGEHTIASGLDQTVVGKYNQENQEALFIVGNGQDESVRSNAFEVLQDGSATLQTMGTTPNSIATKQYVDSASVPGKDGITPNIGDNGNWYLGTTDTGKPSRGEKGEPGMNGERGYSGLVPKVSVDYAATVEVASNTMTAIGTLTGAVDISLGEPINGYDNEWDFTITQGDTAQDVAMPTIVWGLGIAPAFPASTTTLCRLYYVGETLCGEWVTV